MTLAMMWLAGVLGWFADDSCIVGCGSGTLARLVGRIVTVDNVNGEVSDGALEVSGPGHYGSPAVVTFTESPSLESCAVADRKIWVARKSGVPGGTCTAQIRRTPAGLVELGVPASAAESRF